MSDNSRPMSLFRGLCVLSLCWSAVSCILQIDVKQITRDSVEIPPPSDVVCMARYVVHNSDWCSLSYISQSGETSGEPLSRTYSISDGLFENSTGVVYFMVSPLDLTAQDLSISNNCSIIMTLAQSHYCFEKHYDSQDPRCAQVILNGNFMKIQPSTVEFDMAKNILWTRHPVMKLWYYGVPRHKWYFAKLETHKIIVVDTFGGRKFPSVEDYFRKDCHKYLTNDRNYVNFYTVIKKNLENHKSSPV